MLSDARAQLVTALGIAEAAGVTGAAARVEAMRVTACGDHALVAAIEGYLEIELPPVSAPPGGDREPELQRMIEARVALFQAASALGERLAEPGDLPGTGVDTWHAHLVGAAMREGARAHELRERFEPPTR